VASRVVLFLGQLFVSAAATTGAWWWLTYDPLAAGTRQAKVSLGMDAAAA